MSLSNQTIKDIKSIIQRFIDENGFNKSEEDVQSSYTLEILKLLGWDSSKWKINTPQEVKTGNKPDILLKGSSGGTIFIIESKAPDKSLDGKYINKTFKEQICEYCNSEGIYWGVLTNFIEWRIYNSYTKELYYDKKYYTIIDDKNNDDNKLYEFFEKITFNNLDSVKGKIDTNPIYYKKQDEIKEEFFTNLKIWRHTLRTYLFKQLKKQFSDVLQEAVEKLTQKILDRLIFMEVCNDKNIISYDILGSILYSKKNKYEELKNKFHELDEKFNSDLFAEDAIIDGLSIEDELMEDVIRGINKIDFSKLGVHIIGEVYENYLGELLRQKKQEIKLIESKEHAKRKSHGIYYTPDYIVNYIVENTLGEILKNCKTEDEIQKIRVLDPACGSGSFLIRAFDEFYDAYKSCRKTLRLFDDFEIKKKILLYNLYGVDLDERAVDIAKLNLLIKALEGSTETSLTGRKLLPNLNLNIRCGNSLVTGRAIDEKADDELFDSKDQFKKDINNLIKLKEKFRHAVEDKEKEKLLEEISVHEEMINSYLNKDLKNYFKNLDEVKPLNYEVAFCEIFREGRFDCVIGNPPYKMYSRVTGSSSKSYSKNEFNYLNDIYLDSAEYKLSTYAIFSNKGLSLLKKEGYFSFILPDSYILGYYFSKFREYLLSTFNIKSILVIKEDFWKQATVGFPSILIVKNNNTSKTITCVEAKTLNDFINSKVNKFSFSQNYFKYIPRYKFRLFFNQFDKNLIEKIELNNINLSDIAKVQVGIRAKVKQENIVSSKKKNSLWQEGLIDGNEIDRYYMNYKHNYILVDKNILWAGGFDKVKIKKEKLLIRKTGDKIIATYDNYGYYHLDNLHFLYLIEKKYSLKYLLGILNSKLFQYYYQTISMEKGRVMAQTDIDTLHTLKIKPIEFSDKKEQSIHDRIVKLVDEILYLNINPKKNSIKIKAKDNEIDELMYKLYGLTEEEIKIVEGG